MLQPTSPKTQEGLVLIEALLRSHGPQSQWAPAPYAALAVKASLEQGRLDKAKTILDLGLTLDPADSQLQYLYRVVERTESSGERRMTAAH